MSQTTLRTSASGAVSSDDELLAQVRAGQVDAYGELWRRHVRVALAVAGRYSTIADPEDIVQEAFQAVFVAVCDGGGPTQGFRPYLSRTVRNVAVSMSRRRRAEPVGGLSELADRLDVSVASHETSSTDRVLLVEAFQSLPERWRAILWLTVVEDLPLAEAAEMLGIAPNAGAALVRRAREGLRRAWLVAHASDTEAGTECRWVVEHLPLVERGTASAKYQRRIDAHTATCQGCARAALEVAAVARRLPAVLIPVVLTGGAAAEQLLTGVPQVAAPVGDAPASGDTPSEVPTTDVEAASSQSGSGTAGASTKGLTVLAGLLAAVAVTAAAVVGLNTLGGEDDPSSEPSAAGTSSAQGSGPSDEPGTYAARRTDGTDGTEGLDSTPNPPGTVVDGTAPQVADDSTAPSEPVPGLSAEALGSPTVPDTTQAGPTPASPVALTVTSAPSSGLREWLPVVRGEGAPAQTVKAVLDDGTVVGTAPVVDGHWSLTLDRDLPVDVEHTVSVRYAGETRLVAVGTYTFVAPLVRGVDVVETSPGVHEAVLRVTGTCARSVEAVVDGGERPDLVLDPCVTRVVLPSLTPGTHTVELRYVDEAAGRVGAARHVTVTVPATRTPTPAPTTTLPAL